MSLQVGMNRFVNSLGIAAMLAVIGSGIVLLSGPRGESEEETPGLLGLSGESWLEIHEPAAAALILIVLVHLALHWRPVLSLCRQCVRRPRRLVGEPVVLLAMIFVVLLTAAAMPDESEAESGGDRESSCFISESVATYMHVAAGAAAALVLSLHVSRRWRRTFRAG